MRAGIVASVIANQWRRKGTRPFKPKDFMPKFGEKKRQMTAEEQMAYFMGLTLAMGGKIIHRKESE